MPTQQVIGLPKPMIDIGTKDRTRHGFQLPNLRRHASGGGRPGGHTFARLLQRSDALCHGIPRVAKFGGVLLRQRL